jgi:hypothetical protein
MIYLYRSAPNVYQNSSLGSYFKQKVYGGARVVDLFQWPLIFGALALLAQLLLSIRKDIRRRKEMKYGRRLKGPVLVTPKLVHWMSHPEDIIRTRQDSLPFAGLSRKNDEA